MFKSLAISAIVALSGFTGVAAQAAPTTCALRTATELHEFTCDHSVRTNRNGHNVNDITFFDGGKRYDMSVIWWLDGQGGLEYAEVFMDGQRNAVHAYKAQNGSWCLDNQGSQFCIF